MKINLLKTQKVLSPTQISLADYTINPFRGCEFNCLYCYAKENKNAKQNLDKTIGVKINAPEVLRKELRFTKPKIILLGATTECFQYCQEKYPVTKQILEILNEKSIPYTILTKSHLIKHYLPLISKQPTNKIYFTLNCAADEIIRSLEEKSSSLSQRLDTIKEIIQHDIDLRIHCGPFIPYVSSIPEILGILPNGVKEIDIELYHHKMGNFEKILDKIEEILGKDTRKKIEEVYRTKESYEKFTQKTRDQILQIKKHTNYSFFYIIPDYNTFYTPKVDYTNKL